MLKSEALKVLEENKGKIVSGAEMAKALNISRTSIWKVINSLRNDGYNIKAVTKITLILYLRKVFLYI